MTSGVSELTADLFESAVRSPGGGTWLVHFWAAWCAPCQALEPTLADLAATEGVQVGKVDVSAQPELGDRFGVRSLPTIIVFRDGVEVRRLFGTKTRRQLLAAVGR